MQVLLFLIQHAGEQVTKEQIFAHVWNDRIVTDDTLSVTVSKIRKALGDKARSPTFIKTLPGEGYVLIAKVKKIDAIEQGSSKKIESSSISIGILSLLLITSLLLYFIISDEDSPSNPLDINSIAVLPFDDLSLEQDNQHLTNGLSDVIINQLSQIKSLKVISRYSSFIYQGKYNATEIGEALQVENLLDGSVQKIGEQVRINVRIFNTNDGQQLWSKTFDSDSQNIFRLQDDISAAIQEIVQPNYSPKQKQTKTIDAQAYEWYLMGQYHWRQRNPKSLSKAVTFFKRSLDLEPDYTEAHVGLGIAYAFQHTYANWSEKKALDAALPHIMKALDLNPNSATALAGKGMILTSLANYKASIGEVDESLYQQAQQAFIFSLELADNATTHHWYSSLLGRLGKDEEVIFHLNRAIELNPLSATLKQSFSSLLSSMGKQDSAQRMYKRALALEPDSFSRIINTAKANRLTYESVLAMAEWQVANPELFTSCSSDFYCEQLVLAYLSIDAHKAADELLAKMEPKHRHFLNWMNLITASKKRKNQKVLSNIANLVQQHPDSRSVSLDLVTAQVRAAKFSLAKKTLSQLYPHLINNKKSIVLKDITADNYLALVSYAVTLSNLQQKEVADFLLHNIQTFLKQDRVFDKIQAEFTLAEINAQLDNKPQALIHLASALDKGWLASYTREWWSLQDNHLLQPLHDHPEFKLLLKQYQEKLNDLRAQVTRKLTLVH